MHEMFKWRLRQVKFTSFQEITLCEKCLYLDTFHGVWLWSGSFFELPHYFVFSERLRMLASVEMSFLSRFPYYLRQYTSKFLYEMRPTKLSNSSINVQETNTFTHFCFVIILNSLGFLWKSHNMFLNTYISFYHNRNLQLRLIYHVCVSSSIVSMIKNHR